MKTELEISHQDFTAFVKPDIFTMPMAVRALIYQFGCTVTFLFFCLLAPVLLIVVAILKSARFIVERYISRSHNCTPLSEDDAVWQQDRPTNRHIIHTLMVLEGAPDIEKLRQIIQERLVYKKDEYGKRICPRLTQRIHKRLGCFFWKEDETFNVSKHVMTWEGTLPKSLEDLDVFLSEICSSPLPDLLSPWQFIIVPTAEEDYFGVVLRFHHSVADGVALARVFVKNLFDVPPLTAEPKKFATRQRFYMWCKAIIAGPFILLTKFFSKVDASKIHGQELCGKKVVAWSKNVELSLVKKVKNAAGTTVNDVMVSCLAGALHDYLKSKQNCDYETLEDMLASVPVDIRSSSNQSVELKNKFALVFLRLPIVAKNAVDRLLATKQRMDIIKTSAEPLVTAVTVRLMMLLPNCFSKPLIDFFSRKMSCVLSNVPGPQQVLYLGGQKIVQSLFWVPQRANIGVGLSIFSYAGGIRIGVFSDESIIPNPREVVKGFETNFLQLVRELNVNEGH